MTTVNDMPEYYFGVDNSKTVDATYTSTTSGMYNTVITNGPTYTTSATVSINTAGANQAYSPSIYTNYAKFIDSYNPLRCETMVDFPVGLDCARYVHVCYNGMHETSQMVLPVNTFVNARLADRAGNEIDHVLFVETLKEWVLRSTPIRIKEWRLEV